MPVTRPRPYRSRLRAQQAEQTRRSVIDAARGLFLARGFTGTGMREVAASAGVALETVYSHFSSKKGLLRAVVDVAAVGDESPERLAERPEFLAMGTGPRSARIRAASKLLVQIHLRTARLDELFQEGARSDAAVAEMLEETRQRRRLDVARAFELIVGRSPTVTERDGLWVLVSPEVYRLLVDASGWTDDEFEAWIEATIERVLPRS